jgi:hypothetical protein
MKPTTRRGYCLERHSPFPYYNSGDLTSVYSTQPGSNDSFSWAATTSFQPARTTYWGRGASDGSHLYFSGTIDSVSMYVSIGAGGLLGPSWQTMTPLPTPAGGRGRSLHQSFIYQGRLYVLGGWYGDGLPLYADAYYAPILTGGALGSFVQTTSLPVGMCGHSATVSAEGKVYVAYGTNLFLAKIAADGSIGSWATDSPANGMNHNNYGNTAAAVVSNLLVVVDYSTTFVYHLNSTGSVSSTAAVIANPAYFAQRSVYANNGKVYVTAATGTNYYPRVGNIYRIDGLPFTPSLSIRVSQVELCWDTDANTWYQLQFRSSLTTNQWVPFFTNWLSGDGSRFCTNDIVPAGQAQRFYQVVVTNSPP